MVADLFSLGVNRFSIGAQSFDDAVLRGYGRIHDAAAIDATLAAVRTRTNNISLDLICGGPGQSMESWTQDLRHAIDVDVPHVSIYPLTLEDDTPLTSRVEAGECEVADEDLQADMMLEAEHMLTAAGFERYEVASYAKPGFPSYHNTAYWTGAEYLGLGAGASSMLSAETAEQVIDAGLFDIGDDTPEEAGWWRSRSDSPELARERHRRSRLVRNSLCASTTRLIQPGFDIARIRIVTSPDDVAFAQSFGRPHVELEMLNNYESAVEDLMLGMRMSSGVSAEQVRSVEGAPAAFERLEALGLVREQGTRFVPTQRGWLFGNEVYGAIWSLAGDR